MKKIKKFLRGFRYAWQGIKDAVRPEMNLKVHLFMMTCVIIAGFLFHISAYEWLACLLCFAMVVSGELFNCAIERLADRITRERDEDIRFVKDVSAGAVLFAAIMTAICGLVIFLPKLLALLS